MPQDQINSLQRCMTHNDMALKNGWNAATDMLHNIRITKADNI